MRVGPAADTLRHLTDAGEPPFDLVFIDADKDGYPEYLRLSLPLLRPGGLLLGDNTLRGALEPDREQGTKQYNREVAANPALTTTLVPILRQHGLDGRFR